MLRRKGRRAVRVRAHTVDSIQPRYVGPQLVSFARDYAQKRARGELVAARIVDTRLVRAEGLSGVPDAQGGAGDSVRGESFMRRFPSWFLAPLGGIRGM